MATVTQFLNLVGRQVGLPYVYGGDSPTVGFDCSGLIYWAMQQLGDTSFPRTSEAQWASGVDRIPASELAPGDLVFEQWPGDNAPPGHVAVYAGNGQIIQAPAPGQNVQQVSWSPGQVQAAGGQIIGYGRIPQLTGSDTPITTTAAQNPAGNVIPGWLQGVFNLVPGGKGINELGALLDPANWIDWLERGALMLFGGALIIMGVISISRTSPSPAKSPPPVEVEEQEEAAA